MMTTAMPSVGVPPGAFQAAGLRGSLGNEGRERLGRHQREPIFSRATAFGDYTEAADLDDTLRPVAASRPRPVR